MWTEGAACAADQNEERCCAKAIPGIREFEWAIQPTGRRPGGVETWSLCIRYAALLVLKVERLSRSEWPILSAFGRTAL